MEEESSENEEFRFQSVGEQLRTERERQELSLSDVAAKTRIPVRHLEAIETSNFAGLPGATYTLGFTRNYARALGLDATKLSAELRDEMEQGGHSAYQAPTQSYEPTDVARVPPRALAWTAAAVAVALVIAYLVWRSFALGDPGNVSAPATVAQKGGTTKTDGAASTSTPVDPKGQVLLTARDTVWVRIYDADKKRLYENEMKAGEQYPVPADAKNPMINTGRPQAIDVTIGGKIVAPLGKPDIAIKDVGVSAAALVARVPETPATGATKGPSGTTPTTTSEAAPPTDNAAR